MTERDLLALELDDVEYLVRAPVVVFLMLAATDGGLRMSLHRNRLEHFSELLGDDQFQVLIVAMRHLGVSLVDVLNEVSQTLKTPLIELQRVRQVIDEVLPPASALSFKTALFLLAERIVEAASTSSGLSASFGPGDRAGLSLISQTLDLLGENTLDNDQGTHHAFSGQFPLGPARMLHPEAHRQLLAEELA